MILLFSVANSHSLTHRLEKICEFLKTTKVYGTLELSRIEGIETFNSRFNLLATTLKKKPYDALEPRREEFDTDYKEFQQQLTEFNV